MLIGYTRISTSDQTPELQIDALNGEGCDTIFSDVASGAKTDRPGLNDAIDYCRDGDTLVVWKLDRMGRSMSHLIKTIKQFEECGVVFARSPRT